MRLSNAMDSLYYRQTQLVNTLSGQFGLIFKIASRYPSDMTTQRSRTHLDRSIDRNIGGSFRGVRRQAEAQAAQAAGLITAGVVVERRQAVVPPNLRVGSMGGNARVYAYDVRIGTRGAPLVLRDLRAWFLPIQGGDSDQGEPMIRVGQTVVVIASQYVMQYYPHPIQDFDAVTEPGQ